MASKFGPDAKRPTPTEPAPQKAGKPASGGSSKFGPKAKRAAGPSGDKGLPREVAGLAAKGGGRLLRGVLNLLGAPQQIVFKGTQGLGDILHGDVGAGLTGLRGALGEAATFGQAGGDIGFSEAATPSEARRRGMVTKLPTGLETAANLALDPLLLSGVGKGPAARQAVKGAKEVLGAERAAVAARKGLRAVATPDEEAKLVAKLARGGMKPKRAEKAVEKLTTRAPATPIGEAYVAAKQAGKAAAAPGIAAIKTSAPGKFLRRSFVSGSDVADRAGRGVAEEVKDLTSQLLAKTHNTPQQFQDEVAQAVRAAGKYTVEDDKLVQQALEQGDEAIAALKQSRPELEPVVKLLDRTRRLDLEEQVAKGVIRPEQVRDVETYMRRLITEEAKQASKGRAPSFIQGRGVTAKQAAAKRRSILPEATAQEINALQEATEGAGIVRAKALGKKQVKLTKQLTKAGDTPQAAKIEAKLADTQQQIAGLTEDARRALAGQDVLTTFTPKEIAKAAAHLPPGTKLFEESAITSALARKAESARAMATADWVQGARALKDEAGERIFLNADEFKAASKTKNLGDWIEMDLGPLGVFHTVPELKQFAERVSGVLRGGDEALEGWKKGYMAFERWWKGSATAMPVSLAFPTRNARSNFFLNWLDNIPMTDPAYRQALRMQKTARQVRKSPKFAAQVADEGFDAVLKREIGDADFALFKDMQKHGVIGGGFFDVDLPSLRKTIAQLGVEGAPKGPLARRVLRPLGPQGKVLETGRKLNQAFEHNARMANFIVNYRRLGNAEQAARRTKQFLFDYGDLTPFEQKILKRVIPFYTFMRKNTPLQVRVLMDDPAKIAIPEKIASVTTAPLGEDAPEWMRQEGGRTVRPGVPGLGGLALLPDRVSLEAFRTIEELVPVGKTWAETWGDLLGPIGGPGPSILKGLVEETTGRSAFTGGRLPDETAARIRRMIERLVPAVGRVPQVGPLLAGGKKRGRDIPAEVIRSLAGLRTYEQEGGSTGGRKGPRGRGSR